MQSLEAVLTAENAQRQDVYENMEESVERLLHSHQIWLDCAQRFIRAEMNGPSQHGSEDQFQGALSRLGVHTSLARAEYERSLKQCQEVTTTVETTHGTAAAILCRRLIDVLSPPVGWLHVVKETAEGIPDKML